MALPIITRWGGKVGIRWQKDLPTSVPLLAKSSIARPGITKRAIRQMRIAGHSDLYASLLFLPVPRIAGPAISKFGFSCICGYFSILTMRECTNKHASQQAQSSKMTQSELAGMNVPASLLGNLAKIAQIINS